MATPTGRPPLDLRNQRFGRLVALMYLGEKRWRCRCDCGHIVQVWSTSLRNGTSQSCGCLQKELLAARRRTHGMASHTHEALEYRCWLGMKARCTNPNGPQWKNYGGRGITICDRWLNSFELFFADMGPRPSPAHSLDRVDNNRGYEPNNCRWALPLTQHGNMRTNRLLTFNGRTQHLAGWARTLEVPVSRLHGRLRKGWSVERTLSTA